MLKACFVGVLVSVGLLAGCAAESGTEDAEATDGTSEAIRAGRLIPEREVAQLLRDAGFEESEVPRMVCTAKHESSFYERASNRNRNGSIDRGLFQINSIHLGLSGCPRTAEALFNAATNAKCAHKIWELQGNRAWYSYRSHKTECDSYVVDE